MKLFGRLTAAVAAAVMIVGAAPVYAAAEESLIQSTTISPSSVVIDGKINYNSGRNDYTWWSSPVCSYLTENRDGTLTRVEYADGKVYVEDYLGATLINSREIPADLSIFGGYYSGATANYLVFGQRNPYELNDTEVIRVVKYTKNWERVGTASLYGENTYIPFSMGSLRMTEINGRLYVYTCHQMYKASDGENHQANLTMVVDESKMMVVDKYTRVYDVTEGYVSHSYNEFIDTDGDKIYRVDHGDSYPRGIYASRCNVGDQVKNVAYSTIMSIPGAIGDNATGASLGGMELSDDRIVLAGNSVDYSIGSYDVHGQRNIFITTFEKENFSSKNIRYITNYTPNAKVVVKTPQLVKVNFDKFVIMWEEYESSLDLWTTKYTTCNDMGELTSPIYSVKAALSDCKPILCSDGFIRWYVSDDNNVRLYGVDAGDPLHSRDRRIPKTAAEAYQIVLNDYMKSDQYVSSKKDKGNCSMYDFADINGDGIPELFISQGTEKQSGCRLYTFDGYDAIELTRYENLNKVGSYGAVYTADGSSYILGLNSTDTESVLRVYEMRDHTLWNRVTFSDNEKDTSAAEKYYRINGNDVGREEYAEEVQKYAVPRPVETGRRFYFETKAEDAVGAAPKYVLGDVNSDGAVDSGDASLVLAEYAAVSTGEDSTLGRSEFMAADVNFDGAVDSNDASLILAFYSHVSTGGEYTDMAEWLDNGQP